jgi:membrane dipeptidase
VTGAQICLDAAAPLITPRRLPAQYDELRAGGVDAVLATVSAIEDARYTVAALGAWLAKACEADSGFRVATSAAAVREAKASGELAIVLHLQGGSPIEADLNLVDVYHALGVRVVQLTYNTRNLIGDGCLESVDGGLSDFGRRVVGRLATLGIAVDVSHAGVRTSLEAIEAASAPVVATHANSRVVCDTPRNLTDDQIRRLADSGGMIGLCAFPAFVTTAKRPTIDHLVDHAVHIGELVGPQHIGIGLDFAEETDDEYDHYGYDPRWYPRPPWVYPDGIRSFAQFQNLRLALDRRGFSAAEVAGILGGNFLRVFESLWRA